MTRDLTDGTFYERIQVCNYLLQFLVLSRNSLHTIFKMKNTLLCFFNTGFQLKDHVSILLNLAMSLVEVIHKLILGLEKENLLIFNLFLRLILNLWFLLCSYNLDLFSREQVFQFFHLQSDFKIIRPPLLYNYVLIVWCILWLSRSRELEVGEYFKPASVFFNFIVKSINHLTSGFASPRSY